MTNCVEVRVRPRMGPVEAADVQMERGVREGVPCTPALWNRLAPAEKELLHKWQSAGEVAVSWMGATVECGLLSSCRIARPASAR